VCSSDLISADGFIVTNDHVAGKGVEFTINMSNGNQYPARLIGTDFISDISLLKIDEHTFRPAKLGVSNDLMIGEWIIALGNPFGLFKRSKPTVTVGVVSAIDRDFGQVDEGRIYQDMIQTDAAINTGNSGGPLVNVNGEVIGMNTFIYTGDRSTSGSVGIGFAIPIDRVKEIVAGIKEGSIDRNFWTGLSYQELYPDNAQQIGYDRKQGIIVTNIVVNSPADKAGLKLEDILVEINGLPVVNEQTVNSAMGSVYLNVGDTLPLKVWRNSKIIAIEIRLEKRLK